jgi:hypothetical protein
MLRKENAKLKNEMVVKSIIFEQKIAVLKEELAKMEGRNRSKDLERQQSQMTMMEMVWHFFHEYYLSIFIAKQHI